jgi:THO complex subunit 2
MVSFCTSCTWPQPHFFCSSRNILTSPHCNPGDSDCIDVLTTAYHTLLSCALKSWSTKHSITPDTFVIFVHSVLESLPSSSSTISSNATVFGELLVDMIWAVDEELDEIIGDSKNIITNCSELGSSDILESTMRTALGNAMKAKKNAEEDKETLAEIIKKFLVRNLMFVLAAF